MKITRNSLQSAERYNVTTIASNIARAARYVEVRAALVINDYVPKVLVDRNGKKHDVATLIKDARKKIEIAQAACFDGDAIGAQLQYSEARRLAALAVGVVRACGYAKSEQATPLS